MWSVVGEAAPLVKAVIRGVRANAILQAQLAGRQGHRPSHRPGDVAGGHSSSSTAASNPANQGRDGGLKRSACQQRSDIDGLRPFQQTSRPTSSMRFTEGAPSLPGAMVSEPRTISFPRIQVCSAHRAGGAAPEAYYGEDDRRLRGDCGQSVRTLPVHLADRRSGVDLTSRQDRWQVTTSSSSPDRLRRQQAVADDGTGQCCDAVA